LESSAEEVADADTTYLIVNGVLAGRKPNGFDILKTFDIKSVEVDIPSVLWHPIKFSTEAYFSNIAPPTTL
jgi:hypothetical protein